MNGEPSRWLGCRCRTLRKCQRRRGIYQKNRPSVIFRRRTATYGAGQVKVSAFSAFSSSVLAQVEPL